ncbi:MAG: acyl-CoA dehydrogenase family protein [Candidatus Binatia bacterium]
MDFALLEEHRMLQDTVRRFVRQELLPLESLVLQRDTEGHTGEDLLPSEIEEKLLAKAQEAGLWGLDVPEEFGGLNLSALPKCLANEELHKTITPFIFPPDAPNLHMLMQTCTPEQREHYLIPYARGEKRSAIAISEPGAGSDPAGMQTTAVKKGDQWVINGRKIWISRAHIADFMIVMAVTDKEKRARGGITAFLVDKDTPGLILQRQIPVIGGHAPWEIVFEELTLPDSQVLGQIGQGFAPMQLRLTVRRLEIGSWCVGLAQRCLDMMIDYAKQRVTFGQRLADRQAVQWFISDAATDIHAARLMTYHGAWKFDQGEDVRQEASMLKVFATEMATRVADQAMQVHGGMGMSKDLPLEFIYRRLRPMRIFEGPSEVHRWVIARSLLRD